MCRKNLWGLAQRSVSNFSGSSWPRPVGRLKTKEKIRKVEWPVPEKILSFIRMFDSKITDLEIVEYRPRFRLFEGLLGDDVKQEWGMIRETSTDQDEDEDLDSFESCMIDFLLRFFPCHTINGSNLLYITTTDQLRHSSRMCTLDFNSLFICMIMREPPISI